MPRAGGSAAALGEFVLQRGKIGVAGQGVDRDFLPQPRQLLLGEVQAGQLGLSALDSTVKDVPLPDGVTIEDHDLPQAPALSANALARYEFPLGNGTAFVQGDVMYSAKFCFTVLCAPVEQESAYTVTNARVGFTGDDGRWEVAAFVNNLTEEKYRVYAFDSSLFAGVVAGVYAKPRTFGLTGTYRFGGR